MSSLIHPARRARATDEFPPDAARWPADISRREFLQLASASLALAGLVACARPRDEIVPYVTPPESVIPGRPRFYATAVPVEGFGRGILVESHLGRPTKIEGNPDHPESRGATDAMTQAAVLSLYDPDRSRAPRRDGHASDWATFEAEWRKFREQFAAARGAGLAVLTEPTTSPTLLRELHALLDALPDARWFQHTPLARYDLAGAQPDFDFSAADVVLAIGSDCFFRHPACLRYARSFAQRRRVENGRVDLNRFYAIESSPSVTGSLADFRLPASPARTRFLLDALAHFLESGENIAASLSPEEARFVTALARDLREHAPAIACVAGPEQDDDIQRWALALNAHLGAAGRTVRFFPALRSDSDRRAAGALPDLARTIDAGEVRALFILSANPAYTAPADLEFAGILPRVSFTAHLGTHFDETAARCRWHLPESHFLETWSDLRAYDGTTTILQPLIAPLFASRSAAELLRIVRAAPSVEDYELVRATWRESPDFVARWPRWLRSGVVDGSAVTATSTRSFTSFPKLAAGTQPDRLTLTLEPDPTVLDGRLANNPWLQELPKPLTKLVWDNAALIAPALAAQLGLTNGDLVTLEAGGAHLDAAVLLMPGQASSCVTLSLGYGRTAAGAVGNGRGFDAYRLRTSRALWGHDDLTLHKLGRRYALVSTQEHFALEGRDLVRVLTAEQISRAPASAGEPARSLFADWPRDRYAWGMTIDLSTCLGCNACVVACQAENNIPVVGKDQVARGREMHWLRVDRYFSGDASNPRLLHQPVPCMQCENAPCELVCPVAATVHSSEGLNDMVYNRCVGTRYCSNNCPYKVRRFNFLNYNRDAGSPVDLQKNPAVSVRARGVMEKCTYCVQRINAARISAEKENRRIRDGEVRTACQQVCPVEAIIFGDLNDPASRVVQRKREPVNYALLAELNTRPRTTYLAKMLNAPA